MGRLELPASCSQSKRATNCATPGYEVFQLWSNMWSRSFFDQLQAREKVLSAQVSQGFPGFPRTSARTRASRTQITRAANYATPGYEVVGWPGRILPKQARYQLRFTRIFSFSCMIPCGEEKSKFFVSVGAAVVKPDFARVFQLGNFRRKLLSQRLPGLRFQENG